MKITVAAAFTREHDVIEAVKLLTGRGCDVVDVYSPYPLHGLEEALGWRRSRLPAACFLGGAAGVALATWFQFWATAQDWPLNVGGRPWNSLPAFVPVIFEMMVLFAGLGVVLAWLWRCGLYPGKDPGRDALPRGQQIPGPYPGTRFLLRDDQFVGVFAEGASALGAEEMRRLLHECGAVDVPERGEGERP